MSHNDNSLIVGDYKLGKTIGKGTFGKVKLGIHLKTKEKVAIKILEKKRIVEPADVERVAREIHILKILRHPNIIQLYEIIERTNELYLIMEYASGGELFDYIVLKEKIPEVEAARFFNQLLSGVSYLHRLGIVHRDLKPENLLLDQFKNLKIVDFGLSNLYKPGQTLKTACGSPCYAAPEMIAGKKYGGEKVDVWSCGVILYALICGYLPFEDQVTANLYKKIMHGVYEVPEWISDEVKEVMAGILTVEPEKRWKIEEVKKHKWVERGREGEELEGIMVEKEKIQIDESVVIEMEKLGYERELISQVIEMNKHNSISTAYYLILKKQLEADGKSISSIYQASYRPLSSLTNMTNIEKSLEKKNKIEKSHPQATYFNHFPIEVVKKIDLSKNNEISENQRTNRYDRPEKTRPNVFSSKSPDYVSVYNTLSKKNEEKKREKEEGRKEEEEDKKKNESFKMYFGPVHLSAISSKPANHIIDELNKSFKNLGIECKTNGKSKFLCSRDLIRFEIELCRVSWHSELIFLKMRNQRGDFKRFTSATEELLISMKL